MELLKQKSIPFPGMKVRVWEILGDLSHNVLSGKIE